MAKAQFSFHIWKSTFRKTLKIKKCYVTSYYNILLYFRSKPDRYFLKANRNLFTQNKLIPILTVSVCLYSIEDLTSHVRLYLSIQWSYVLQGLLQNY